MLWKINIDSFFMTCQTAIRHIPVRCRRRKKPPHTSIYNYWHIRPPQYRTRNRLFPHTIDERLTPANRDFIKDYIRDQYQEEEPVATGFLRSKSPLLEEPWPRGEWNPETKRVGLLAVKVGSYPMWTVKGKRVMTTLLWVKDNHVISYQPWEQWRPDCADFERWWKPRRYTTRHFDKVVVGADGQDPRKFTSSYLRMFHDTGLMPKRRLGAFYISRNAMIQPGTPLSVEHYRVGDYVDCQARSISFGFQGVCTRWGFGGGPSDEFGSTKFHRKPGSIGGGWRGHVMKGKKMPGMMGGIGRGVRGLKILRINPRYQLLWVSGTVAGPINAWVRVVDTSLPTKRLGCGRPLEEGARVPRMPTWYPGDPKADPEDCIEEESWDSSIYTFLQPSITYEEETKAGVAVRNR